MVDGVGREIETPAAIYIYMYMFRFSPVAAGWPVLFPDVRPDSPFGLTVISKRGK
jgi:hypothetical protein